MTREEFYKLTDVLNSDVLGNFMHGGEASEVIAQFEEAVEHSNILEQKEPVSDDLKEAASMYAKEEYSRKSPATLPNRCIGCYAPIMYAFMAGAKWRKKQMMKEMPKWKNNWLGHTKKPCIADEIPGHNGKQLCVAGKCISIDDLWTKLFKED